MHLRPEPVAPSCSSGSATFGIAMVAMAPWLPLLLVQDYWRWVGFMTRRPGCALANDTVFNCVQGAAFAAVFVTHTHSIAAVIACWGLGSAGRSALRAVPAPRSALARGRGAHAARPLVGEQVARRDIALGVSGAGQVSVFIMGAILGPAGLGGLKAAQTLVMGPTGRADHGGRQHRPARGDQGVHGEGVGGLAGWRGW